MWGKAIWFGIGALATLFVVSRITIRVRIGGDDDD